MDIALSFDDVLLIPKFSTIESRKDVSLATSVAGVKLSCPILSAPMPAVTEYEMAFFLSQYGGLPVVHRMQSIEDQVDMVKKINNSNHISSKKQYPKLGIAIGINEDFERIYAIRTANIKPDLVCVDVAFGGNKAVLDFAVDFKKEYPEMPLLIGNFASIYDIAPYKSFLTEYKDSIALRVGVGGSGVCTTRIVTGCGMPTLQSVFDINEQLEGQIDIVADGGIRNSGCAMKAFAAGAKAIMLGGVLAGCAESPGGTIKGKNGVLYKSYYGAASHRAKKEFTGKIEHIEGDEALVPYTGGAQKVLDNFCDGLRSGCSYCNATSILELSTKANFCKISSNGVRESQPYDT